MKDIHLHFISVIMPCYNSAPYVEEAISSILHQTHRNSEVIVVDDGSSDGSAEIVEQLAEDYPERIKLKHQNHQGPYPARNLGLRYATGNYLAFLDADDWWHEDCLERLLNDLVQNNADLAYCGWQNVGDHASNLEPYIPPAYEEQDEVAAFLRGCPWPIHAALVKRNVVDAVQGFSERLFSSMDYDLWLRILGHTRNIVRVPRVLAYYRWHGSGQISANKWKQVIDAVEVRRDFITQFPDLVAHLARETLNELVEGQLLKEAYRAYWKRDLINAQKLFREAFTRNTWCKKDLKYLLPALMPSSIFNGLVGLTDSARGKGQ